MAPDKLDYRVDRSSELPLGAQLAGNIRTLIEQGELESGARLPSVRELAQLAEVNVNTVRSVYGRLEEQGLVASEQGRGTFVAAGAVDASSPPQDPAAATADRAVLRREIERLEAELARRPQPPPPPDPDVFTRPAAAAGASGGLLSAAELQQVRDSLLERLDEIESARSEVIRTLERLSEAERSEQGEAGVSAPEAEDERTRVSRTASTLGPVRMRWVGGA